MSEPIVLARFTDEKGQDCVTTRRGDVITTVRTKPKAVDVRKAMVVLPPKAAK